MSKDFELSIVKNIKNNQYDIRCIINDTEPYTLYCATDIAKNILYSFLIFINIFPFNELPAL